MPSSTPRESRIPKNFRTGLIELLNGSERYVVKAEQGNFSFTIGGTSLAVYPDRGRLVDPDDPESEPLVLEDQDQPVTGSWTAYLRDMFSNDYLTLADFTLKYGRASRLPNDLNESGYDSPLLTAIQWWPRGRRHGDDRDKGFRFEKSRITSAVTEGSPNLITCNFTSYLPYPKPAVWKR